MGDGSIKYGLIRVLFFNREVLRIADHYLRPLLVSESYISHGESQMTL